MPQWLVDLIGSAVTAIGAISAGPFLIGMAVTGYVAAAITSIILSLSGWLTGFTIGLQSTVLSNQNVIVEIGWAIVRDVANLGFVLAIIIIAVATILRFEEYGVKKLLPRLIAAAILVNFSYAIAALFVDFSQTLTEFFFNKITEEHSILNVGFNLLGAFGPQRVWSSSNFDNLGSAFGTLTSAAITLITGPWLNTLFNLIMIFTMLVLAFMLLLRYLWLSFLVIISPIVWLFWVIPGLEGQFNKWWNKFLEWIFFAPVVSFFLYLAFISRQALATFERPDNKNISNIDIGGGGGLITIFQNGVEIIVLAGIMIAGIIVAQNMGITGAKGAIGVAKKVGAGVQKGVGSYLTKTAPGKLAQFGTKFAGTNKPTPRLLRTLTAPVRGLGKGIQALQGGTAGRLAQKMGLRPPPPGLSKEEKEEWIKNWKPNNLLGHIVQSTQKEFKKKGRPLSQEEKDRGWIESSEEEESRGATREPSQPSIVPPTEQNFKEAKSEAEKRGEKFSPPEGKIIT